MLLYLFNKRTIGSLYQNFLYVYIEFTKHPSLIDGRCLLSLTYLKSFILSCTYKVFILANRKI